MDLFANQKLWFSTAVVMGFSIFAFYGVTGYQTVIHMQLPYSSILPFT